MHIFISYRYFLLLSRDHLIFNFLIPTSASKSTAMNSRIVMRAAPKHSVVRLCRWQSNSTIFRGQNPQLRPKVFTKPLPSALCELSLSTYPNPLYSLNVEELLKLSEKQYSHLLAVPFKNLAETDQFCNNVIQIVHENIISNTGVAARYLCTITNPEIREVVFGCLKYFYKDDRLRLSLLLFMENPMAPEARRQIFNNINHILFHSESLDAESAQIALSYLKKLALTGQVNEQALFLNQSLMEQLLQHLPGLQELYACLFHLNMKFADIGRFEELKKSLLFGSNIDKVVARTGILDPKWHDVHRFEFSETHKLKMVHFFTCNDLVMFTNHAIKEKDVVNANLYLDLLVSKFELSSQLGNHQKDLQYILSVMLNHSMTFKGAPECLKFLKYMLETGLEIKPAMLLRVLSRLREDSYCDEALFLINFLHTEKLDSTQKSILVREIMQVITQKFAEHPQVAVGYFAAMFKQDSALQLLQDLGILDLVYGDISLFSAIKRADIHEDLTQVEMSHSILHSMYLIVLKNLPHRPSPELIKKLYDKYMLKVRAKEGIFNNIDESILTLLVEQLLRVDPYATNGLDLVTDHGRFSLAKEIVSDFTTVQTKRQDRKVYLVDLVITSSLLNHGDYGFAAKMIKRARDLGLPLSFNQIYPFIMYHYSKGELEKAERWYVLMTKNGVKSKSVAADKLFKIAKDLNWQVKGTSYRKLGNKRNQKAREQKSNMAVDRLAIFKSESPRDINLLEELGAILHATKS